MAVLIIIDNISEACTVIHFANHFPRIISLSSFNKPLIKITVILFILQIRKLT